MFLKSVDEQIEEFRGGPWEHAFLKLAEMFRDSKREITPLSEEKACGFYTGDSDCPDLCYKLRFLKGPEDSVQIWREFRISDSDSPTAINSNLVLWSRDVTKTGAGEIVADVEGIFRFYINVSD